MENKNNTSLVIILVIVIVVLLGGLGFVSYKYSNLKKSNAANNAFNDMTNMINGVTQDATNTIKDVTNTVHDDIMNLTREGYVVANDVNSNKQYKIYGVMMSYGPHFIVSYNNVLYQVRNDLSCIDELDYATFDSDGNYKCQNSTDSSATIHKFNGKPDNLVKVTSSIPYDSTDGYGYVILIYKSGEVETKDGGFFALNRYNIKDFISEKCTEYVESTTTMRKCKEGKLEYKVILQDGTEKTIYE